MTVKQHNKRAIGAFSNHDDAEKALRELKDSGFPMDQISIVGHDINQHSNISGAQGSDRLSTDLGQGNKVEASAATGAATGVTVGGLTGLLVGLGIVAIPGVGPIMLAGAAATTLATALAGGAIGAATGGVVGALVGLGIPEDRARVYSDRLNQGDYLVILDGSENDIHRAQTILSDRGIMHWGIYDNEHATHTNRSVVDGNPNR
jgi:hypothetical protein